MPAVLSDEKVCFPLVPSDWYPVLEKVAKFLKLESRLREQPGDARLASEIRAVHQELISSSDRLHEPESLRDVTDRDAEQIFARSLMLTMRIASSVVGDDDVLDTAGCRTLELYQADFLADAENQQELRNALAGVVSISDTELKEIEDQIESDVAQSLTKQKLVRALRDRFGLWKDAPGDLQANVFGFFDAIYPGVGIAPEEVDVIVTGTMIFFCLPFKCDDLTTERFRQLEPEAQQPIREFLQRVNRFSQYQFAHFPVFGFRRGSELDPELLDELEKQTGIPRAAMVRELSTLTAIIPIDELDKYVVHDVWGHSWQACMLGFDDLYEELATFAQALDLDETAIAARRDHSISFRDCFVGEGDQLRLDRDVFERFVNLEVAERLPVAMTPVLAEVLADVAEYKLVATAATPDMANSSALKKFPAKLDLTLRDVLYYFRQATKVFRLWANRESRQQTTIKQLVARGASEAAARVAVTEAAEIWKSLESEWLAPEMVFARDGESVRLNVVSRLMLNFLAIHRETLMTYGRIGELSTGDLPIKGLRDLLLICVAVFFEKSPSRNLWRVDEFLSLKIEPLCRALVGENPDD